MSVTRVPHLVEHRRRSAPRGRALTFGMLAVAALAWVLLLSSPMSAGMRQGVLTGGSLLRDAHGSIAFMAMPGMSMARGGSMSLFGLRLSERGTFSWAYFAGFLWIWAVMLAAMMFPVALPGVRRYRACRSGMSRSQFGEFLAGYYAVYLVAGAGVYLVMAALQSHLVSPTEGDVLAAAVVLSAVGIYQLSSPKIQYLDHCLATPECLSGLDHRAGRTAGWRDGLAHGWSCLACCGPLMIVLLLVGMMNLAWMAILTVLMVLERVLPARLLVARVIGGALIAGGLLVILISPGGVPARL